MTTLTATTNPAGTILALDLGKYKSVACLYDGDPDTRITILSDSTATFRSNGWSYVGQIGTRLFFTSDTGDGSIDIGTIEA